MSGFWNASRIRALAFDAALDKKYGVDAKVAYVIYRPPGSNAGVVEVDGKRYYIDATHRLVDAGYKLDMSKRKSTNDFPGKSAGDVSKWMRAFPAHALSAGKAQDEAEFKEADHPRRDDGKFGSGTSSGSASLKTYATKEEWPEHVKAMKLPPAWTDVKVSDDPNADLQAIGKDAKGRPQYVYSKKFQDSQAALKFERIASLEKDMPLIEGQLDMMRRSKDQKVRDNADCLTLIKEMGVRPGGDEDTGAKVKAYGASTLEGRHIVIDGDKVSLQFIGKKGKPLNLPVENQALAANLRERKAKAGDDGKVYGGVTDTSLLTVMHDELDHGGYKTKDLRTHLGTSEAAKLVASMPAPKNEKEYKVAALEVAKAVSAKLGNTPTVALQSYIAPQVFAGWRQAYA